MGAATVNKGKQKAKGSKKGRKYDRHRKRSPAADRYRTEGRDKTNKIKKLIKEIRRSKIAQSSKVLFKKDEYKDQQAVTAVTQLVKLHPNNAKMAKRQLTKQDHLYRDIFGG